MSGLFLIGVYHAQDAFVVRAQSGRLESTILMLAMERPMIPDPIMRADCRDSIAVVVLFTVMFQMQYRNPMPELTRGTSLKITELARVFVLLALVSIAVRKPFEYLVSKSSRCDLLLLSEPRFLLEATCALDNE